MSYTYGDANHAHAVTSLSNGNTYAYDANGNMTQRYISGQTYNLSYDAENHMTGVSGAASASFAYNGDGQRVIATVGGDTTVFIGNYFEWHDATELSTRYYYAGATRIAMHTDAVGVQFILGDHLGSTSVLADASGVLLSSQGYMPWGETRFGSVGTEYQFTGQYREGWIGLDYFNARWYDSTLGRFVQADSIVPLASQGVQAWDRYAFVSNNPVRYIDPTGNKACDNEGDGDCNGGFGSYYYGMSFVDRIKSHFHIKFVGDWSGRNKDLVYLAAYFTGRALAVVTTAADNFGQAFNAVYNASHQAPFIFEWDPNCTLCMGAYAYTHGSSWIEFINLSSKSNYAINNIIHELGHAFDWAVAGAIGESLMPRNKIGEIKEFWRPAGDNPRPLDDISSYGFAGSRRNTLWHQNPCGSAHEEFADTFLGWVFGAWERGANGYSNYAIGRMDFLSRYMGLWVNTTAIR